jgi:PAS domain S-box-containing protein
VLAVVASAAVGGPGPGLLATAASLGVVQALSVADPVPGIPPAAATIRMVLLGLVGIAVSAVAELRQRALRRAESEAAAADRGAADLRKSEEQFRRIVDTALEGIWQLDAEGRTVYCNRRMAELLGYTREEILGRSAFDFLAPESLPKGREAWGSQRDAPAVEEYVFVHRDGHPVRMRSSAAPVHEEGRFAGAVAMFTDVTDTHRSAEALRKSEARKATHLAVTQVLAEAETLDDALHRILAAAGEGLECDCGALWQVDTEANALRCLETWHRDGTDVARFESLSRQTSFSPGVGLPGRVWTSGEGAWIVELGKDANFPRGEEAMAAGLTSAFAFPIAVGREVLGVMELFSRESRAPDPELLSTFLGVGSQIGQFLRRKRMEDERVQLLENEQAARREAEAAGRAKDDFLAVLSHELRTPLNAIVGWAHLLRTGQLDEEQAARAVEVIDRNAKAQAQIVADVLDVSRIVMGKIRLETRPVDLSAVVETALDGLRPAAEAKAIRLETALAPGGARVTGDVDRLQQVAWNLVSNAVKFTPSGGRVLVQLRQAGGLAELRVEDTGMGIEADLLPHVFERFRQGDSSTTRAHGGLGLGLALVRHLVEMHGGAVTATSPGPNKGATFVVTLPLAPGSAAERPSHLSTSGNTPDAAFGGGVDTVPPAASDAPDRPVKN